MHEKREQSSHKINGYGNADKKGIREEENNKREAKNTARAELEKRVAFLEAANIRMRAAIERIQAAENDLKPDTFK